MPAAAGDLKSDLRIMSDQAAEADWRRLLDELRRSSSEGSSQVPLPALPPQPTN
jgi:hypothetical protein